MVRSGLTTVYQALALVTAASVASSSLSPRQSNPFSTTTIANFNQPWALAFLPDDRVLVTEQAGTLRILNTTSGNANSISGVPRVSFGGQGGLGDVVLHPNFRDNNLVYFSYAEAGDDNTSGAIVARARLSLSGDGGSLENVETIWTQDPKVNGQGHFSHRILFNGDNSTLFISSGDRQQFFPAQDMGTNLGKIIRLNDDGSIPEGNPFADQGNDTLAAQVWALGVRNPLGIDFDADGRLWEIEMGPRGGDELNVIERGDNYGWPLVSDGVHYNGTEIPDSDTRPEFVQSRVSWTPVISPASMLVYRGDLFSGWTGNVIISGLGSLGLVRVEVDGDSAEEAARYGMGSRMRCVREASDGSLWALEDGSDARLLRLTPEGSGGSGGSSSPQDSDSTAIRNALGLPLISSMVVLASAILCL